MVAFEMFVVLRDERKRKAKKISETGFLELETGKIFLKPDFLNLKPESSESKPERCFRNRKDFFETGKFQIGGIKNVWIQKGSIDFSYVKNLGPP